MPNLYQTNLENYYGTVEVFTKDGKFFWSLDDHSSTQCEEIPESLYNEIVKFLERSQNGT